jgi:hypothetical protein
MKLSLFRRNPIEGLVIARSETAEEAARKRSANMVAWNKLGRRNSSEPDKGSDTGSEGSSSDDGNPQVGRPVPIIASAPADPVPEQAPTAPVESDPQPTIAVS